MFRKRTRLLLLIIGFLVSNSYAQEGIIDGVITDVKAEPVFNAEIYLLNISAKDSSFQYSDEKGGFRFNDLELGNKYILKIRYIGYQSITDTVTLSGSKSLHLTLREDPAIFLDEVLLKGDVPLITRELNKTKINVANSVYSRGENGFRIMELVPGVSTNSVQGISYRGQESITVYVDDIKLRMSGDQLKSYLRGIPSESIESLEFMSVTGAEYEASDSGPVLNIILKKEYKFGFSGYLYSSFQIHRYASQSIGGSVNYRKGIFNLQVSSNLYNGKNYSDNIERQIFDESSFSTEQVENFIENPFYRDIKVGLDAHISENHVLSGNFEYGTLSTDTRGDTFINLRNNRETDSVDNVINEKKIELNTTKLDLAYRFKLDSVGSRLDLVYNYLLFDNLYNSDLEFNYYLPNNNLTPRRSSNQLRIENPLEIVLHTAAGDLIKKINETEVRFGMKISESKTNNQITFQNSEGILDERSNTYNFEERIMSAYSSISKSWDSWNSNFGLRLENTDYYGVVVNTDQSNEYDYLNLFPSFFLQKNFGESQKHQISLSFNRKITRPNYQLLNPFEDVEDTYFTTRGNPNLLPYFSYTGQLSWIFKSKYTMDLGWNSSKDIINEIYLLDENTGRLTQTYANINDEREFYLNIGAPWKINNSWRIRAFSSLSAKKVLANNNGFERSLLTPYLSLNSNWDLPGDVYFEVNADYKGVGFVGINELRPQGAVNFLAKKNLFNNKVSATFFAADPFQLRNIAFIINSTEGLTRYVRNDLPTTFYSINLSFNFMEGKKATDRVGVERKDTDEQNRIE